MFLIFDSTPALTLMEADLQHQAIVQITLPSLVRISSLLQRKQLAHQQGLSDALTFTSIYYRVGRNHCTAPHPAISGLLFTSEGRHVPSV